MNSSLLLRRRNLIGFSVTLWLIIINSVLFVLFLFLIQLKIISIDSIAIKPSNILAGKYLWTFITSMFMHGGFAHLFINMFVLFSLGGAMERILGRKRFLWFYLISGIVAGGVFVLLSGFFGSTKLGEIIFGSPMFSAVGASGAIFAIAGLFMVLVPRARFSIIFFPFFSLPGYIMIPLALILTWVVSVAFGFSVGNTAHLGGFLSGMVYGVYLKKKFPNKTKQISRHFS